MNVTYAFEDDYLDDVYRDVLREIYCKRLRYMIFEEIGEGFHGVEGVGIVQKQCFGCQFYCASQKHHDVCLLDFEDKIEYCLDYALADVDETDITREFIEKLSCSPTIPHIPEKSIHSHLLSEDWRRERLLTEFNFRSELGDRLVCMEYFLRNPNEEKPNDIKG